MARELIVSYTKKDFEIETFCTGGPGGQNQNKKQMGVRIRHLPTGLWSEAREHRQQLQNRKAAFERLAEKIKLYHKNLIHQERVRNEETVRTYHEPDNRTKDHASGYTQSYREVMQDIGPMIEARTKAIVAG